MLADFRYAFRQLIKTPGFTFLTLLTLALGIGANTAIFSFVNGVLLQPLPYPNANRIVSIHEKPPDGGLNSTSTLSYLDWAEQNTVFEYIAVFTGESLTLTGTDQPRALICERGSAHFFDVFGVKAALGRTFAPGEDEPGKDRVVVLADSLWQTQFGADEHIIGRTIQLNNEPYTVIGVLAKDHVFERSGAQIWRPLSFTPETGSRDYHWLYCFALLKPGVTAEQAQAQFDTIGARIAQNYPASNKGWGIRLQRYSDRVVWPRLRHSLYLLFAAVGAVLLIACVNVANLTLARGLARGREVAIRGSLGASRGRLIRQFLTASMVLSLLGCALGLAVGDATLKGLLLALPPHSLPPESTVALDGRVLLFTLTLSLLTGLLCGLVPALQLTQPDLMDAMKQGGTTLSAGRKRQKTRSVLVIAEVALAFVLLTSSSLLVHSFFALGKVDVAFEPDRVITAGLPISEKRFPDAGRLSTYLRQILSDVGALPGVREVALTSALPMNGKGWTMPFQVEGHPLVAPALRDDGCFKIITPTYFRTVGLPLIKGRALDGRDVKGAPPVVVINEAMVKKYFPNEEPLGKRILIQEILLGKTQLGPEISWEVVGVVTNEKLQITSGAHDIAMYVPSEQCPQSDQYLVIRASIDPSLLNETIRRTIQTLNPDQTLPNLKTLGQIKAESINDERFRSWLLGIFAGLALMLSAVGIYGVLSYSVVQRTQEIGIRAALGANAWNILGLVLRNGMTLVALGLAIGFLTALGVTRLLSSFLFGIGERDPVTLVAAGIVLSAVALLACYLPARRATKVDPLIALRSE